MTVEEYIKKNNIEDPVIIMADTGLDVSKSARFYYGNHTVKEANGNVITIYSFIGNDYRIVDCVYAPDRYKYRGEPGNSFRDLLDGFDEYEKFYSTEFDNLDDAISACENAWNKLSLPEKKRRVFFGIIAYGYIGDFDYEDEIYIIKDTR